MTLRPVTITEARDQDGFNVSAFVQSVTEDAQATPGKGVVRSNYCLLGNLSVLDEESYVERFS